MEALDNIQLSLYTKCVLPLKRIKIIATLFLSFLPCASFALPDHGKIIWKFSEKKPCVFKYKDGVSDNENVAVCYYMLANLKTPVSQFNRLPTEAAQKEFLRNVSVSAASAFSRLEKKEKAILGRNNPKNIPSQASSELKLKTMMKMEHTVLKDGKKACQPFLWPKAQEDSYLRKTNGNWLKTWRPCMKPFYERWGILNKKVQELQSGEVAKSQKKVQTLLSKIHGFKTGSVSVAQNSVKAWALSSGLEFRGNQNQQELPALARHFVLDQKSAPPPSPHPLSDAEYRQRGYFNRGYAAGMERLKDDALLSLSHSLGLSHTVGDPQGKAKNIIYQKGGTCAVEAQYEVLKSYGQNVTPKGLAEEALKKGYYAEPELKSGDSTGWTFLDDEGKLLRDHGFDISAFDPTDKDPTRTKNLDKAIKKDGGALVGVEAGRLWHLPDVSGAHEVFVTGEEVSNKNGEVLGYYINDTGTGEAARFVSKRDFDRAWRADGYEMVLFHEKPKK